MRPPFSHTRAPKLKPVFAAELTKALSLRSVQATFLAVLIMPAALSLASGLAFTPDRGGSIPFESLGFETAGFGQPLVILLAALIMGTEYLDGQLRTTLLATPRRGTVIAAKLFLVGILAATTGLCAIALSVVVKHASLRGHGLELGEFSSGMMLNLLGVALNYALIALIAAAITAITRTIIATLVVLIPLVLGVTISLVGVFPALRFLPDLAGLQLLMPYPGVGLLDPLPGTLVMTSWATVLMFIAWALFRRRDVEG